jgi:predicted phage-related endonuclease
MKKVPAKAKVTLETVATAVMAIHHELTEFKSDMADFKRETQENFSKVFEDMNSIRFEVRSIKQELIDLYKKYENSKGQTKEIDYALTRISRIEKHLGITSA